MVRLSSCATVVVWELGWVRFAPSNSGRHCRNAFLATKTRQDHLGTCTRQSTGSAVQICRVSVVQAPRSWIQVGLRDSSPIGDRRLLRPLLVGVSSFLHEEEVR